MSDIAKWALLVAGIVALIALIVALPFTQFINSDELSSALTSIVDVAGGAFRSARGLINCFLSPFGIGVVSGLMVYWVGKWIITMAIKITTWVYHFIFK